MDELSDFGKLCVCWWCWRNVFVFRFVGNGACRNENEIRMVE